MDVTRCASVRPADEPVDVVVIGAMKCGTTSLHRYLGQHPDVAVAPQKEVNFFFPGGGSGAGRWEQGVDWYAGQFPDDGRLRVDSSPGYTSPDHPGVPSRMAAVAPSARLVYMVRDPLDRAVSQYRHHRRDGAEPRSLPEALLDDTSHYVRRSRFAARLAPFLAEFPPERVAVIDADDLAADGAGVLTSLHRWIGLEPIAPPGPLAAHNAAGAPPPPVDADLAAAFRALVAADAAEFAVLRRRLVAITPGAG